jgi:hypothetical protein
VCVCVCVCVCIRACARMCINIRNMWHGLAYLIQLHESEFFMEANSCSASQEFPCALWTMKVHPSVYNSSPLSPILSQINPVQTFPFSFFKIMLILSPYLHMVSSLLAFWQHGVKLALNESISGTNLCTLFLGLSLEVSKLKFCPIWKYMILWKIFFLSNLHRVKITVSWQDLQQ